MLELYKIMMVSISVIIVPAIVGYGALRVIKQPSDMGKDVVYGNIIIWALFQIICFPSAIFNIPFSNLKYMIVCIVIVITCGICIGCREIFGVYCKRIKNFILDKNPLKWIIIGIVALWMIWEIVMQHSDADDYEFVAYTTSAIQGNTIFGINPNTGMNVTSCPTKRIIAPFSILIAIYADIINVHPAVMSHSVMPALLVGLAYIIYDLLGMEIFKEKKNDVKAKQKCYIFLLFLSVMLVFGGYSTRSLGAMLILRSWQGKAVLAAIMLPLIFEELIECMKCGVTFSRWLVLMTTILAATVTSAMTEILVPPLIGCYAIIYALRKKNIISGVVILSTCWPCILLIIFSILR